MSHTLSEDFHIFPDQHHYKNSNIGKSANCNNGKKQIDNNGAFEYSDEIEVSFIPKTFALYQNFPNPFNPVTNINFSILKSLRVSLGVYNITGEEVFKISDKFFESGNHTIKFDGSLLPSGIYFYRLRAGSFVETKKMLLLK